MQSHPEGQKKVISVIDRKNNPEIDPGAEKDYHPYETHTSQALGGKQGKVKARLGQFGKLCKGLLITHLPSLRFVPRGSWGL